jgi:hypothetical protein
VGYGGIRKVTQITELDAKTVARGCREVQAELQGRPEGVCDCPGVDARARKKTVEVLERLRAELEEHTGGDPMSEKRWVRLSPTRLRDRLAQAGCPLSTWTVHRRLNDNHYSLKGNVKTHEPGGDHRDRNTQFA